MNVSEVAGVPEWLPEHLRADGIEELYPPQAEAVEAGVTQGDSLVASVPTASGKTLVAELAMLSAVQRGGKALYIVPLRALASEKRDEFEAFSRYGVDIGVSTGNYESEERWLREKDIIVATSEKVDSLVRNDAAWLSRLDCVVADEVHLVDDAQRGPTLEVTLAKLRRINPGLQVVALSATIGNADALAEWLDAELVDSEWRPIELRKGVHFGEALHFDDGSQEHLPSEGSEKATESIVRDTLTPDEEEREGDGEATDTDEEDGADDAGDGRGSSLVFVNSRRNAEGAAKRLANVTNDHLNVEERTQLRDLAAEIRDANDSETGDDLADAVEKGAAFHHAGLCVTGETQVMRADGTSQPIREIVQGAKRDAIGLDGNSIGPVDITDTFEMGERPVLELVTRTGNQLQLSRSHPLPTLGENGIEWTPATEISTGEYVARPRSIELDPETPTLRSLVPGECRVYRQYDAVENVSEGIDTEPLDAEIRGSYTRDRNIPVNSFRELCCAADENPDKYLDRVIPKSGTKPVSIPEEVDRDICWLAGAVAGDGYTKEREVALTGQSNIVAEFERIAMERFNREPSTRGEPDGNRVKTINSKTIAEILESSFGIPQDPDSEIRLPSIPLSDGLLGAYISGLFDADGSVSPRINHEGAPCIEFYTTSETFATQLKTGLIRFGIIAYRDTRDHEGDVHYHEGRKIQSLSDVERLTIYGVDQLRRFREEIGFRHDQKSAALEEAIHSNPDGGRGQTDLIPTGLGPTVHRIRKKKGLSLNDIEPAVPKATLSRYENRKTPMKRETFQHLAAELDSDWITAIARSDLYWDRVEAIEPKQPQPLYDLSTSSENFVANGVLAHNTSEQRSLVEDAFRDRLVKCIAATPTLAAGVNTPSRRVVVRDWRRYSGEAGGMQPLSVLEVHQMMGRAGRPGMDPYGEALLLAKSHDELDELFERYVWADPEPVQSKLAAEPAMRTHLLATIASGFADSREGLLEFLEETLYASQTDEDAFLEQVMDDMLAYLERNGFVEADGDRLTATGMGHTVSRLYLDPMSAAEIIDGLRAVEERPTALGLYHLVARTPDMYQLYLRSGEEEEFTELAYERESEFPGRMPSEFDEAFDDWLAALKTAKLLEDWADEVEEDRITERYGVGPGDIRGKVDTAEWLLGAAEQLAAELDLGIAPAVREARVRVQHGVREELVDLAGVRGVGRKRARRLFEAGIEDREDLRNANKPVVLGALRGREKTAESVLENAGHTDPDMEGVEPDPDAAPVVDDGGDEDQTSLGEF